MCVYFRASQIAPLLKYQCPRSFTTVPARYPRRFSIGLGRQTRAKEIVIENKEDTEFVFAFSLVGLFHDG